jgi:hypothetical protein
MADAYNGAHMLAYEKQLDANLGWALKEGSLHFEESSKVHQTLHRITRRLGDLGIPYAVVGGMAMFAHGYRRFTEDVDLLVTRESMNQVLEKLEGLGYTRPAGTSTKLRDAESGVRIEFLITGHFPGDGKPKPISFPDPADCVVELGGIRYLNLPKLIDLKLASGLSAAHRVKDLADVQELIRAISLPRAFAQQLDPSVRDKYLELWQGLQDAPPDP